MNTLSSLTLVESEQYWINAIKVNLGKWALRYLFANFIDEEIKKDVEYRINLSSNPSRPSSIHRMHAQPSIILPDSPSQIISSISQDDTVTPKSNGGASALSIGVASPQTNDSSTNHVSQTPSATSVRIDEDPKLENQTLQASASRSSTEKSTDYPTENVQRKSAVESQQPSETTPAEATQENTAIASPGDNKDERPGSTLFGKKFRMNFPRKMGRSSVEVKPAIVDEKSEESNKWEDKESKPFDDYICGTIANIRKGYEAQLQDFPNLDPLPGISPSLSNDTPKLQHPPLTTVIIQEESPDAGGVADLYRGTVSSVGTDASVIEKVAPSWLGELLLKVCRTLAL